jgi:hypothetical protein
VTVHAFVDESSRSFRYIVAVVMVEPSDLSSTRTALRGMLLPGSREVHFCKEKDSRRRAIADVVARLPVTVTIYTCEYEHMEERVRQACIARLTRDLLRVDAHRLVLDSRSAQDGNDQDRHDAETIRGVLGKRPSETLLVYEHMTSTSEEMLWIADVVAWYWGAGKHWRQRIVPVISAEVPVLGPKSIKRAKPGRPPFGG